MTWPGLASARSRFSSNIRVDPNFGEKTFRGHARGIVKGAYPIRPIPPLIAFAFSLATFLGVIAMKRARRGMRDVHSRESVVVGELTPA